MTENLVFAQTFEGLLRSVQGHLTPPVVAGLKARGLDVSRPLLPAYPLSLFAEVVTFLAEQLHPGLESEAAVVLIARHFMDAYGETMVGRAMMAMIRLIGPRRALERVTRQFRTANNYSETRLLARGPTEYELWVNDVRMPGWYIGIVSRGLELAGGKNVKVEVLGSRHGAECTFRCTWS